MTATILIFVLLTVFGYSAISGTRYEQVEVTLKHGTLRGYKEKIDKYVSTFLGIPFAEPPIGDLRFRKPIPITKKSSVTLMANKLPKCCMQPALFIQPDDEISEDCLYLNVWTPVNLEEDFSQNLRPVIVFIHPGSYSFFGSAQKHFNGSVLSSFGDVVVVTFNFRLGPFGFLSVGNADAPGNAGLYDQALALEWVQENIAYFGGDPHQVTIFGDSAGGIAVSLHTLSPVVHNTFKRAIMASGPSFKNIVVDTKEAAIQKAKKLAELLGCNNKGGMIDTEDIDIDCLRKIDAEKIVKLQILPEFSRLSTSMSKTWFAPVIGEAFIPIQPNEMLLGGYMNKRIDLLVGSTSDEGSTTHELSILHNFIPKGDDWQQKSRNFLTNTFNDLSAEESEKIIAFYFNNIDNKNSDEARTAYLQIRGDVYFNCEIVYFNEVASISNNLYHFLFDYEISNVKDRLVPCESRMSCHNDEVPFSFGIVSHPKDIEVSKKWMQIMTDFARTGTVEWPKYERNSSPYYVFTGNESNDRLLHNFRSDACKLWKPIIERNY